MLPLPQAINSVGVYPRVFPVRLKVPVPEPVIVRAPVMFRKTPLVRYGRAIVDPPFQTSEEIVRLVARESVPEFVSVTALLPRAFVLAAESAPALIVVVPENCELSPERIVVPVPN